jgi:allantoin racemase
MKISIVHVNCEALSGPYTQLIEANFNRAKRDDTVLEHRYVRRLKRASDTVFPFPILLNKVDVVEQMLAAGRGGADGVMVACSGDPGVAEGRPLLPVPVVGPMEAALHLACGYGYKIGVVTVADRSWSEYCEMMVNAYGLGTRFAGVKRIRIPSMEAFTVGFQNPEVVAKAVAEAASELVEQRDADAIVIGSAGLSVMSSAAGLTRTPDSGVPIFDCLTVGLKMTELRVDLTRKFGLPEVSRVGYGERLADKDIGRLTSLFGMPVA